MKHRVTLLVIFVAFTLALSARYTPASDEHPGEHPGTEQVEKDAVKEAIKEYIEKDTELKGGYFLLWDDKEKQTLRLEFSRFHEEVRYIKDEDAYFMCTDFVSLDNRRLVDVDFWLKPTEDGSLEVTAIKIHKVNNIPRFIYEKDSIKPLEQP